MAKNFSIQIEAGDFIRVKGKEYVYIGLEDNGATLRLVDLGTGTGVKMPLNESSPTAWRHRDGDAVSEAPKFAENNEENPPIA